MRRRGKCHWLYPMETGMDTLGTQLSDDDIWPGDRFVLVFKRAMIWMYVGPDGIARERDS